MRKLKSFVIIFLIASVLITAMYFLFFKEKGITGNEWFEQQDVRMEDISAFCEEMDEVFTLYIGGYMSDEDFANEEILLRHQFSILKAKYEKIDSETNILTGKHSWLSKKGEEVINSITTSLESFLEHDYAGMDKESILANYLVLKEKLEDDTAGYIVLRNWLDEYNNIQNAEDSNDSKNK